MVAIKAPEGPRLVLYHQTIHDGERFVSLSPLIEYQAGVTHLVIAAIHLNRPKARNPIHLNDHPPNDPRYEQLWSECRMLQAHRIKVMCMLGGAAKGTYALLDSPPAAFETQYSLIRQLILTYNFDGIDLDVEEHMSLHGIVRLIEHLKNDFGRRFIISLAPVATAMHGGRNLSGFSYEQLESIEELLLGRTCADTLEMCGDKIDFYNVQFYCGHGTLIDCSSYERILQHGWSANKIVVGSLTSWQNGYGWLPIVVLKQTWAKMQIATSQQLSASSGTFGGVMGWEYFNSRPGGTDAPYQWCCIVSRLLADKP